MKIVRLDEAYWPGGMYGYWCPGCDSGHEIDVENRRANGAQWKYDGNASAPTVTPSVNIRWGSYADPVHAHAEGGVCHHVITAGKIYFCDDCTHALRGQTVDLPEIPEGRYLTSVRAALRA